MTKIEIDRYEYEKLKDKVWFLENKCHRLEIHEKELREENSFLSYIVEFYSDFELRTSAHKNPKLRQMLEETHREVN